ncbi:MAG: HlyD family efflux transporter periplasmic adaptor subunit [Prosthecochloris sp.]|uniref:Efflux transporter, RND family, MFP subunit n=1 Tax=Prosthecochloris aestuarii (strain DSM 271 / SK 413) TaxID=290512 RepID=B4S721_PROA2|nr:MULTISPECIES: HlyD family efflux transporter periplasmic adaptor subunit [Prosthecochloris]ACF45858.1 efflux transporter, RND family, MFP subunit [Prosthecochloris aestuarii DSM 271]MCW8798102.1 HlyD family efflux transporter periplasmic adaptor subunit [Prosthecochloris sp.]
MMSFKKLQPYLIAVLIVAGGILVGRIFSSSRAPQQQAAQSKTGRQLSFMRVTNGEVQRVIEISGKASAVQKIDIYAEVSGVFAEALHPFREGSAFRKGDVLLRIDDGVYRNTVQAEKSALLNTLTLLMPDLIIDFPDDAPLWKNYLEQFRLNGPLRSLPPVSNDRVRNYIAARNIYTRYYAVRSMEETLAKYRITAPFEGVVTVSSVNPGMLIRTGQKIGEFAAPGAYELEASVGIGDAQWVHAGDHVVLESDDLDSSVDGVVARLNQSIDDDTQTVGVYIKFSDDRVRDGMYMTADLHVPVGDAVAIPRSLLLGGDGVYALEDSLLTRIPVDVVAVYGSQAIVRSIPDGTTLLAEPVEGVYQGMVVRKDAVLLRDSTTGAR